MILTLVVNFTNFTDNSQYSSSFRDTPNQSSMVYGNWIIDWLIKSSGNTINSMNYYVRDGNVLVHTVAKAIEYIWARPNPP